VAWQSVAVVTVIAVDEAPLGGGVLPTDRVAVELDAPQAARHAARTPTRTARGGPTRRQRGAEGFGSASPG
jgi:hypothetical protein